MAGKESPQHSGMEQAKARVLFEQGAIFLLLDFPEGSEFGIDNYSWTVGPNFKGIKMIPPGIHFIYYSSVNADHRDTSPRSGFFYNFSSKEIVVRRWNLQMEDIDPTEISEEQVSSYSENKKDLDKFLGPYPYERYKHWVSLSNHITESTLSTLQPDCGFIYAVAQFQSVGSTSGSRRAEAAARGANTGAGEPDPQGLPELHTVAGTSIKFSDVPRKRFPVGSSPSDITKYSLDSSHALQVILDQRYSTDINGILGEIQFAFLCFLIGQNYDAFEQWKKLVNLLCTSEDAILKNPSTYLLFITLLHFQIREIPTDFFVDIVTSNNFLVATLHELFQNIGSEGVEERLVKKGDSFRKHLTEKFGWDFMLEPDEFAPVVVGS